MFVVITAFGVIGCSNPFNSSSEDTYRFETGVVPNSVYSTAMNMVASYGANITYSDIKAIRNYLYSKTISDHGNSIKSVTKDEIRDFLVSKGGFTEEQINTEIEFLETIGNDIAFFYCTYSTELKVWIYAEKE